MGRRGDDRADRMYWENRACAGNSIYSGVLSALRRSAAHSSTHFKSG